MRTSFKLGRSGRCETSRGENVFGGGERKIISEIVRMGGHAGGKGLVRTHRMCESGFTSREVRLLCAD